MSSWIPNEAPQILVSERTLLQGAIVSAVAYGVTVSLYFLSLYHLVREKNRVELKKRIPLLIYITIIFLLGSFVMCASTAVTQMAFIDDRNFPGGPSAYQDNQLSIPRDQAVSAALVLSSWLSDVLLVWRFKVIYEWCRVPIHIVILFPCLMLAGSVAFGTLSLIQISTAEPYGPDYIYSYFSLSLALNITLTIAMVLRLLTFRYRIVSVLGSTYGKHYISIATMILESAALYSTVSIAFLVLLGIGNAVSQVFLLSLGHFQTISTLLIIFRVAQGKSWTEDTATHVMTALRGDLSEIKFAPPLASLTSASSEETTNDSSVGHQECPHAPINAPV